mmetsp:Transcript_10152/g.15124  ORF Transcript_10152/g.15124 Transcript_10152/m.15124 type:complete len:124 (-) Transcript_10152:1108-1479(-)
MHKMYFNGDKAQPVMVCNTIFKMRELSSLISILAEFSRVFFSGEPTFQSHQFEEKDQAERTRQLQIYYGGEGYPFVMLNGRKKYRAYVEMSRIELVRTHAHLDLVLGDRPTVNHILDATMTHH